QALEQVHVLLVLEQRAVQWRDGSVVVATAQDLGRDFFCQQQLEPVQEFRGGWLFLQAGGFARTQERIQCGREQVRLDVREVYVDDALQRVAIRELDVVKEAAAQKGVRQILFVVRGDDHQRAMAGGDGFSRLVDVEFHAVQFAQQVV